MTPMHKISAVLVLFSVGVVGGSVKAAPPASGKSMEADLTNSRVYIKVKSGSRLGHDHGVSGKLEAGSIQPGTGGKLVFAMRTFITDTPDARKFVGLTDPVKPADQKKSSANMLGPDVLDVARYPRATFDIQTFTPADGQETGAAGQYQLGGTFTLHGVSRPLTLVGRLEATTDPAVYRLKGAFAIQQTQYGITPFSALGGLVSIEDQLDIWGEFVFRSGVAQAKAAAPKVAR